MKLTILTLIIFATLPLMSCKSTTAPSGNNSGTGTLPDGPFLEITFTNIIEPFVSEAFEVRAAWRQNGKVTYVDSVDIDLDVDDGEADEEDGYTDTDGRFQTNITMDEDDENETSVEVRADYPTGERVEETVVARRPNKVQLYEQYAFAETGIGFQYRVGVNPTTHFIDEFEWIELDYESTDTFHDTTFIHSVSESATGAGMSVTGSADLTYIITANGSVTGGFEAITFNCNLSASLSLTNPATGDNEHYSADCYAAGELGVEFAIWGEPKTVTLFIGVAAEYAEIHLDETYGCYRDPDFTDPCPGTITATLEPGFYEFEIEIYDGFQFSSHDGTPASGSGSTTSANEITLLIQDGGVVPAVTNTEPLTGMLHGDRSNWIKSTLHKRDRRSQPDQDAELN